MTKEPKGKNISADLLIPRSPFLPIKFHTGITTVSLGEIAVMD
jgi:hypothetical protein